MNPLIRAKTRALTMLLLVVGLAACRDVAAPDDRITFEGTVALDGTVGPFPLPRGREFPLLSCYVSADGENWLQIARWPDASGSPLCYLIPGPAIALVNVPPAWRYVVTAQ